MQRDGRQSVSATQRPARRQVALNFRYKDRDALLSAVPNVAYLGISLITSAGISESSGALNRSTADSSASGSMGLSRITVCWV